MVFEKMKSKRGQGMIWPFWVIILVVLIVLAIGVVLLSGANFIEKAPSFVKDPLNYLKENVFEHPLSYVGGVLGFDKGFLAFWPDLATGLMVGFWLWIVFSVAKFEEFGLIQKLLNIFFSGQKLDKQNVSNSWLSVVGDRPIKILVVGVFYAVLMQIPVLNRIIQIITLEPLIGLKDTFFWWKAIIRSFILAFYMGFLPTAIQQYQNYKIRKQYYASIEREKALLAIDKLRLKK